jgi:hypothetical protein
VTDGEVPWPPPPREPGPWGGGPPVQPPGNTALPPLPGPGGVSATRASGVANPWAGAGAAPPSGPPASLPTGPPRPPFPGLSPSKGPRVDRAPVVLRIAAVLVVVALVAGAAFVLLRGGKQYPSSWPEKVDPIARWVEKERKLSFDHPVEVNFLSSKEYSEVSGGGAAADVEPDAAAQKEMDDSLAQLRALGLVSGKVDLAKAGKTLSDSGTLAFYDPDSEAIYVRGTKITPAVRVTLAHELTHVLQDQHFDLQRLGDLPESIAPVLRALAEGDAGRIEDAYVADVLDDAERAEYEKESKASGDEATKTIDAEVPPVLTALFASPYVFGPQLVDFLLDKGDDQIDAALEDPPTEEVLFDPLVYGTPAAEPKKVSVTPPSGSETVNDGEFGATGWYLLLASRLAPGAALKATDGLAGDAYVTYREKDRVCVRVYAEGDTSNDGIELVGALQQWAAKSPKGTASVKLDGGIVQFQSCDPGAEAAAVGKVSVDLLQVPVTRTQVYLSARDQGATAKTAACFGNAVVQRFSLAQLTDEKYATSDVAQRILSELILACR